MRERFARFMAGRNGNDQLNNFLLAVDVALLLLSTIFAKSVGRVLNPIVLVLLALVYFRMLSRNVYKRREENGRYLRAKAKVQAAFRVRRERWVQRKDYKFFS